MCSLDNLSLVEYADGVSFWGLGEGTLRMILDYTAPDFRPSARVVNPYGFLAPRRPSRKLSPLVTLGCA